MTTEKKQFGKYAGSLFKDPSCITTCAEQQLYFFIKKLGFMVWKLKYDLDDCEVTIKDSDLMPYQYALEYCMMQTTRFGVKMDEPAEGEHVKVTDSLRAWYHWWNVYFDIALTDEEYNDYLQKVQNGEDISQFRPNGDWHDIF